jgi:hypothetical protein
MASSTSLSPTQVLMVDVADLPYGGPTFRPHFTHLAGRQDHNRPFVVAGQQPRNRPGTPREFTALPSVQLHVMHIHSRGHFLQWHCIAGFRLSVLTTLNAVASL